MSVNGQLPGSSLAVIPGSSQRIRIDLVEQVAAWRGAFAHRFGRSLEVTDGYRSLEEQERIFRARYTTQVLAGRPRRTWNGVVWYQRPRTAQAAVPGTSNHGWAAAMDLGSRINQRSTAEHSWAVDVAPAFGFRWPERWAGPAEEWWHFEDAEPVPASSYRSIPGALPAALAAAPPTSPARPRAHAEEADMYTDQDRARDQALVAWLQQVQGPVMAGISAMSAEIAGAVRPIAAFRARGTAAVYLDLGLTRRHASGDQLVAFGLSYHDLDVTDPFWRVPIVGVPGELYRAEGDPTGAAFVHERGGLRHVTAEEHEGMGSPPIRDVPPEAPLWSLRRLE